MQHEAHLVGGGFRHEVRSGGELALVELDQVLGLAAGAVELGIEPFGRAGFDVGDHVADVEAEPRGFDASRDATFLPPGLGCVRVSAKPRTASLSPMARTTPGWYRRYP
ncbi:hypothetical protein XP2010_14965, partial [Xanthomonas perforans]